jgi:hypothetical protein
MNNEATLTGSKIRLKSDSAISCKDSKFFVDSEKIKAQKEQKKLVEP